MRRRGFLGLAGMGLVAGAASMVGDTAFASGGPTTSMTPEQALVKLKSGNERYVAAPQLCAADLSASRAHVAASQSPWAAVVGCADSRVPPELLFGGLGVGEIFVARNAGSMVDTATMGTIEYGAAVLGVPLVVVLGHQRCGAVAAACDVVTKNATFPGSIGAMVAEIVPAARAATKQTGDLLDNAIRENTRRTADKVASRSKIVVDLIHGHKVKVVAAVYNLDRGQVEFLE